jgi:hypothetical protein
MTARPDKFHETGIAAQAESIRATARRFDEATLATAESIRDAEKRYIEGTLAQADAEAMSDAASAIAPHASGVVTLLAVLDGLPHQMQSALPELVNDTNIARIIGVLRFIDDELNSYFADSDTVHLTNALDTGRENLYQALRRSFGYWQMGQDPSRWPPVVADLDFRPERRDKLAGKLLAALQGWVPGSRAQLRGSLGSGTADDYSDIDVCWVVPDQDFAEAVDTAGAALSQVTAVLSLRTDPELARSARRRVVSGRLYGVPLFWRIDIDIRADSVAVDDLYDAGGNPDAGSEAGWSAAASAMENAIAAIKAAARGQADTADGLLRRGCERIGHDPGSATDLADAITGLADVCATQEPRLTRMAAEVRPVADHLLRAGRLA